jgi:hypothetical protein
VPRKRVVFQIVIGEKGKTGGITISFVATDMATSKQENAYEHSTG